MRRKSFSNIYKSLLCGALLTVLATGCNTEDFTSPSTDEKDTVILTAGTALSVDAQSTTRATDDTWAADDLIGVTMLSTSAPATPIYTNRQYKAVAAGSDNVAFNPEPESQKMYYPINGSEVTFKAYYPYTGLADLTRYFLDVSGQSDIAKLDLMTAVHKNADNSTANSKNKKGAHLVFHHRLTMVTVNLLTETGSPIDLTNSTLKIKGMKTTGNYNLMTDMLTPDAGSEVDITIPLSSGTHTGRVILLPREAGPGVTFEVITADGGVYTAPLQADQDLKGGTQYVFNLTLKTTPTLITASIEDWTDGPVRNYDVIHVVTAQGENEGFKKDDQLKLYGKDNGDTDYALSKGGTFIFDGTKWGISSPIYWENFTGPVDFRATSVYTGKLNPTQMDDYLVGEATGVALYNGVHLEMKHAGTKATVKLSSSDGTYSATDLNSAVVTLPQYLNTGLLNGATGEYTIGADKGDISPEKQGTSDPKERVAIFPAQTVAGGTILVKVVINGHVYEVKDASAFTYEQGKHHEIRLDVRKSGVQITAEVIDWVPGPNIETEVRIGRPTLGENENIENGDVLKLFTEETSGGARSDVRGYFTYTSATPPADGSWSYSDTGNPLFWEELPNTGRIFASIERNVVNGTVGYNQSKDYIVATPVDNNGGVGNTALHFGMKHAVSQVRVVLRSSDTYTSEQLKAADIYLQGYKYDGKLDKGVYVPGDKTGDIRLDKPDNTDISTRSYLQEQEIPAGNIVARVQIGTRTYNVTYDHPVRYNAGEITHLYITIKGSDLLVSVKVTGWQDQTPVELTYSFDQRDPTVENFVTGDVIRFYDLGAGSTVTDSKNYVVGTEGAKLVLNPQDGTPWYRDDFANGEKIVAVFPAPAVVPEVTTGQNTFSWNMIGKSNPTVRDNDILVTNNGVIKDRDANVDLTFNHVLSKVTVNIISGTGFAPGEINGTNTTVQLVGFDQDGTVNISTGAVTFTTNSQSFVPTSITANTGATLSYQALVMPQTKGTNPVLVKVMLNGITYNAQWTGSFQFKAGEHHILNITLAKTGLKLSAKIAEWRPGTNGSITID